jgi:TM2 domain-containing membrane protein YozV
LPGADVTPETNSPSAAAEARPIQLRDPYLAAFLAWLIPGAGHFYQRRWGKGGLFMVCILGTFIAGLWMGEGRVVYASWRPNDQR